MKLFNIKTFEDRYNPKKKFHHVNLLGLKFRVANNVRSYKTRFDIVYKTNMGIGYNGIENKLVIFYK